MTPLAQAMAQRGQTAAQVAAAAGVEAQTVRELRDGARPPQPRTALRIANAVGVAPGELFGDAAREPTPLAAELARRQASVRGLARAAGVHENSVYAWAAGKTTPTAEKAVRLAAMLGVPAADLFPPTCKPSRRPTSDQRPVGRASDTLVAARPASASAPEAEAFTRRLGAVMAARGLSAGQVAGQAGVSRETISRWLSGTTTPQHDAAEKVAAALNLPLEPWTPAARTPVTPLGVALVERGWNAQQLAAAAGVSLDSARDWVAGRSRPALGNAHRLAEALDRPLIDLFGLHPDAASASASAADLAHSAQDRPTVPSAAEVLARPATGRSEWRDDAACATSGQDPDRWWPAPGDLGLDARQVCGGCAVLGDCRDAYLSQPDRPEDRDGVWAGLFGHQLRTAARAQSLQAADMAGTAQTPRALQPAAAASRQRLPDHRQRGRHQAPHDHRDRATADGQDRTADRPVRDGTVQELVM